MEEKKYEIHIVSHTHWDREWYATFQVYRMRLVKLIDKLLNIFQTIPEYRYFVLDGQTVVLEDYLEIRPEKREEIKKYVKENKLWIGPWYILPDEFLESGEAIIRNLLFGHKIAQEFGRVMKAGYIPDPFGHISQLPQILRGFGVDSAIFTRGLGDEGEKLGSEFIWESPDGSQVLAIHQIGAYCNAMNLGYVAGGLDLKNALERTIKLKTILAKYARTKYLLFNNGCDHIEPQPELPEIIKYLNENLEDSIVVHSHFEELINQIKNSGVKFEICKGELRSARYFPLLPGVLSSRMYLKQSNERAQTKIEKYTEPLATFAHLEGNKYLQEFINQAWRYLLQCHPHDSICGCSIDAVHEDVMRRFSWVEEICSEIQRQSMEYLSGRIDTSFSDPDATPLVIFNTLNWERSEPVRLTLIHPKLENIPPGYIVQDEKGNCFPVLSGKISGFESDELRRYGFRQEILFFAEKIPPCGYKTYFLLPLTPARKKNLIKVKFNNLKIGKNSLENEYYQIKVNRDGTLEVKDKTTEIVYEQLHIFEDIEDAGDEYNYSPAEKSEKILSTANIKKVKTSIYERSPVTVTLKVEMNLFLPESLTADRKSRSKKLVKCNLQTFISLHSGVKRIDFKTIFDNQVKDHRLRVLFPTNFKTEYSFAEGQFIVNRRSIDLPTGENWVEKPSPTHPQQSFVHINDGNRGLTVINQGLPEYEAIKTDKGTILALTLLRCVGWLSRDDLLSRKGHAGPPIPTNESQCLGRQEFKYSLVIHSSNWEESKIWKDAYGHNIPLVSIIAKQHSGTLPKELSFLSIEPENIIISAIKKSERNNNIVIRFYNIGSVETTSRIKLYKKPQQIKLVNLNEEPVEGTIKCISENVFEISVHPFKIITVGVSF